MEWFVFGMFCLMFCFIAAGFGLVILLMILGNRPYTEQDRATAEAAAQSYLAQATPNLLEWTPDALADFSCQWRGSRGGFMIGQYKGQVHSLSQADGPGLISFYLSRKGRQGFLWLRTSTRQLEIELDSDEQHISANGHPLGVLRIADKAFLDAQGQAIGGYQRRGGVRWRIGSAPLSTKYGAVELRGRTLAEVSDALVRATGLFTSKAAQRPLMRNLAADLSVEEVDWLLAVVALELTYDASRGRRRNTF